MKLIFEKTNQMVWATDFRNKCGEANSFQNSNPAMKIVLSVLAFAYALNHHSLFSSHSIAL